MRIASHGRVRTSFQVQFQLNKATACGLAIRVLFCFVFKCKGVSPACMYVYCMCAWGLQRPGVGVGSFGSGVNRWPLANMEVLGIELGPP